MPPMAPLKILELVQGGESDSKCQIILENVETIEKKLKESGALLVSIVAVMGPWRTGKSFLLDFLLRRLRHQEKCATEAEARAAEAEAAAAAMAAEGGESNIVPSEPPAPAAKAEAPPWHFDFEERNMNPQSMPEWLREGSGEGDAERICSPDGSHDGEQDGFAWRGGQDRCTEGIWLSSNPFVFKDAKGRKVAVLLMDTQGAFDPSMSDAQSATIFGLTALLSAKLVYNIKDTLQDNQIKNLDYITTLVQKACQVLDNNTQPFGHLEFLIRDWQNFREHATMEDCRQQLDEHLSQHMDVEKLPQDKHAGVERMHNTFRSIKCSGLPHPGIRITRPNYDGSLASIDSNFIHLLDDFTNRLIGDSAFPLPSSPLGHEITVSSFRQAVINLAETVGSGSDMAIGMQEAFVKVELASTKEELLTRFKNQMRRIAPENAVVDPRMLADESDGLTKTIETEFKLKIRPLRMRMSEEEAAILSVTSEMQESRKVRMLQNDKEVDGANLKIVASPVVGGVAYFFAYHHLLLILAAGGGLYCHVRKSQAEEARDRQDHQPPAPCDPAVMQRITNDVQKWGMQRYRDVQAMKVALQRFNPNDAMDQLTRVAGQASAQVGMAAAAGSSFRGGSPTASLGNAPPQHTMPSGAGAM